MPAYGNGKKRTLYPDFTLSSGGLQYKDLVVGNGDKLVGEGSRVTIDWAGYTIGYYGRIFETRNRSKGGSFTGTQRQTENDRARVFKCVCVHVAMKLTYASCCDEHNASSLLCVDVCLCDTQETRRTSSSSLSRPKAAA